MAEPELSLFPDLVPLELPSALSRDRRRTARQHAQVAAGIHPLTHTATQPQLGTCGSCAHRYLRDDCKRPYPKCDAHQGSLSTRGAATDVRAWWPACRAYQPR